MLPKTPPMRKASLNFNNLPKEQKMSTFQPKPGTFSLFKNERKTDKQPDYRGEGLDHEGNPIEVAAWIKEGRSGKFMSCTFKPKSVAKQLNPKASPAPLNDSLDDIPF